jgi:cyclase
LNIIAAPKRIFFFSTKLVAAIALLACSATTLASAQQSRIAEGFSTDWEHLTFEVRELAPKLYYLHASGGNTLAFIGPDGTLLVDPAYVQLAPQLKAELQKLQAGKVRFLINSHYHGDHTGGNGAFHQDGAVIVAQENIRLRMTQSRTSAKTGKTTPPAPVENWPTVTFEKKMVFYFNGEEVELFHNQPSHTDGDTMIYFHHANVVHMGDVFVNNLYPLIDLGTGGTIDGYFPVIDEVLARVDDHTQIVPGHGPIATRQELKAYRDMLHTVRERVAARIAMGKSLEEILAGHPTLEFDQQYATNRIDGDGLVVEVYQCLTGKRLDYRPAAKP